MPSRFSHPDADEVSRGLFIGSAPGQRQRRALVKAGITWVVDLRDEAPGGRAPWPDNVGLVLAPIEDRMAPDQATLMELSRLVVEMTGNGERVLIHCHAGLGRAATVACAALMQGGMSLAEAHGTIRERRRGAAPTDPQLAALERFERLLAGRRSAATG